MKFAIPTRGRQHVEAYQRGANRVSSWSEETHRGLEAAIESDPRAVYSALQQQCLGTQEKLPQRENALEGGNVEKRVGRIPVKMESQRAAWAAVFGAASLDYAESLVLTVALGAAKKADSAPGNGLNWTLWDGKKWNNVDEQRGLGFKKAVAAAAAGGSILGGVITGVTVQQVMSSGQCGTVATADAAPSSPAAPPLPAAPCDPDPSACIAAPALSIELPRMKTVGAEFLGICGDDEHLYGYHVPAAKLPADDYSLRGEVNDPTCASYANAIDIGMGWNASRDWLRWLITEVREGRKPGVAEVIGSYDGVNVRYWSEKTGWNEDGIPYDGEGHDTWVHLSIYRSMSNQDHGLLKDWTADKGP